jgi:ribose-phosphate pyrophosphokinase
MKLFSGSSHPALAKAIAKELNISLGDVELKEFSCGENYVRYRETVRGQHVFIVQTATSRPDDDLMELSLMCQAARLGFAEAIHVVIPNLPYARQDRVTAPREAISAKLVADVLTVAGADHVITLTLHSDQIQGFFPIPVDVLFTHDLFVEHFKGKNLRSPIVVSPDVGGAKRAKIFADKLGCDIAIIHKSRPAHNKSEVVELVGHIEGKTCIIYDDMIDTGGSPVAAERALMKNGAMRDIYVAATHAIFSGKATAKLQRAGFKEVVVTDSVPLAGKKFPGLKVLSVAPMLAEVIQHVMRGESVTAMYK